MIIIQDSREKAPLKFACGKIVKCLPCGDYGASFYDGHRHETIWERKSIGDLFGTLTFGYDRFRREIQKAADLKIELIIAVEGSKEKVLKGYQHSQRDPKSILIQLETIEKKYGVKTAFFGNRIGMANYIVDYYLIRYEEWKNEYSESVHISGQNENNKTDSEIDKNETKDVI